MATSIQQRSGTLLNASPPSMRAMLMLGRSNRSLDSRLKGSVSMRRNTSWALRIALSPSHGVEPCAAVPRISTRTAQTPFAWTPMCRSVGSPVRAKSPPSNPSRIELPLARGDDIEVAVQDDRRTLPGTHFGHHHRQTVELAVDHLDLTRLQPALDEAGGSP